MNKQILTSIFTIIGIIVVIYLGVYLIKTQHKLPEGVTQIRWSVDNNPIRSVSIKEYEKQNPNIHIVNDPNADIQVILTQIAGDVPPDIITAYGIEHFRRLQRLGLLEDLTPYLKEYNLPVDKIHKELKDFVYIDDRVYGIPENGGPFCLYYNKDIFDKVGVPYPTNDMTMDELRSLALKLTKYKNINGRQVPEIKGLMCIEDPEFWLRMYGGKLFSDDGKKCLIDSPEAMKGLKLFETMRMKDHSIPTASEAASMSAQGGYSSTQLPIVQGKAAMLISGRFMVVSFRDYYSKGVRIGMVRCPSAPCDNNLLYSKCYCVPKASRHKKEAIEFLSYVLSEENQKMVTNYGDAWCSVDSPNLRKFEEYNPDYPTEDNNRELLKDWSHCSPTGVSPWVNTVDYQSIWNRESEKVWVGEQSMEQACKNTAKELNKIIERNIKNPNFLN